MSLSENIRFFRIQKNITQEQLAAILKVSPQAISKWETGATCPDCSILLALSKTLDVSLDTLFENDIIFQEDTAKRIIKTIKAAPENEQFKIARDLAWSIHQGLCFRYWEAKFPSVPLRHINHSDIKNHSSFLVDDNGFTIISNDNEPIFMLVTKPDEGYGDFIEDLDGIQRIFTALASPNTTKAIIYLMRHMNHILFESKFLAKKCDIPDDDIDGVIDNLLKLKLITKKESTINGVHRVLYDSRPSHKFLGLFLLAKEINYSRGYCWTGDKRRRPFINKNDS
jgi:transcriptional regulator with XRE-family HTH domain